MQATILEEFCVRSDTVLKSTSGEPNIALRDSTAVRRIQGNTTRQNRGDTTTRQDDYLALSHLAPDWYRELERMNRCRKVKALLIDRQVLITAASAMQSNPTIPFSQYVNPAGGPDTPRRSASQRSAMQRSARKGKGGDG